MCRCMWCIGLGGFQEEPFWPKWLFYHIYSIQSIQSMCDTLYYLNLFLYLYLVLFVYLWGSIPFLSLFAPCSLWILYGKSKIINRGNIRSGISNIGLVFTQQRARQFKKLRPNKLVKSNESILRKKINIFHEN